MFPKRTKLLLFFLDIQRLFIFMSLIFIFRYIKSMQKYFFLGGGASILELKQETNKQNRN